MLHILNSKFAKSSTALVSSNTLSLVMNLFWKPKTEPQTTLTLERHCRCTQIYRTMTTSRVPICCIVWCSQTRAEDKIRLPMDFMLLINWRNCILSITKFCREFWWTGEMREPKEQIITIWFWDRQLFGILLFNLCKAALVNDNTFLHSLDQFGKIYRINHSVTQRDSFFTVPVHDAQLWYNALSKFVQLIHEESVEFRSEPGDILTFDNIRCIHGRKGFEDTKDNMRHLVGAYLDWDGIYSRWRVLNVWINIICCEWKNRL